MSKDCIRVLLVEDSPSDAQLLCESLHNYLLQRFEIERAERLDEAVAFLAQRPFDVILLDLNLPDSRGMETCERASRAARRVPIIVLTGADDEAIAVEALRLGVQDYLVKGQTQGSVIGRTIRYAVERSQSQQALRESEERLHLAMESGKVGVWEWEPGTDRVEWSQGLYALLGYESGEVAATREAFRQCIHPQDLARQEQGLHESMERCEDYFCEFRVVWTDGSVHWVEARGQYAYIDSENGIMLRMRGVLSDIDRRKQAEEALRESEERYRRLIENLKGSHFIYVHDTKGVFQYLSESLPAILGYTPEEVMAHYSKYMTDHPANQAVHRHTELSIQGICQPPYEVNIWHKDGSSRWLEVQEVPVSDATGKVIAVEGVAQDITERKRAEEEQKFALDVLQLLNSAGDLKTLPADLIRLIKERTACDAVGLRIRVDDDFPYYEQSGFAEDFVREENFLCARDEGGNLVPGSDGLPSLECTCGLVLSGRTPASAGLLTEGGSFWTNASSEMLDMKPNDDPRNHPRNRCIHSGYESVALIPLSNGKEIMGLLQLNDRRKGRFTPEMVRFLEGLGASVGIALSKKQAEEALRQSERQFRSTFENAAIGIAHVALDGQILQFNSRFCEIAGCSCNGVLGETCEQTTLTDDWKAERGQMQGLLDGRVDHYSIEKRYLRTDGSPVWVHLTRSMQRDDTGKPAYFIVLVEDISQRKQAEEALRELTATLERKVAERTAEVKHRARQLQKLTLDMSEAEDRERRRLAEILHDDLQQVLAAAKFHLGLMRHRAQHDASLQAAAAQIDHMLKDAIDKSRSLSHELSPAVLHHSDFAETLRWLANEVEAKHGLVVHVHAHGPVRSQSDALKAFLYKAAREMLFNVVKHARVNEARIRVRRLGRCICLSVSDRGRGFDPQELKEAAGFGLLSIRERIELLGGRMTIKSAKGKGSTFRIAVPDGQKAEDRRQTTVGAGPRACPTPGNHGGLPLRVLLADDHEIVREGLISLLSEEHAVEVVGEAANGREAVDLAGRLKPDVVIMDVSMPLIDGDEATRQIKMHLPKTRVIALSMYEEPEMVERMHRAGAEGYVLKTAPSEELLAAIRGKQAKD